MAIVGSIIRFQKIGHTDYRTCAVSLKRVFCVIVIVKNRENKLKPGAGMHTDIKVKVWARSSPSHVC